MNDSRRKHRPRTGPRAVTGSAGTAARGAAALESVRRDVRYAFRAFLRAPLAAATVVITVALGLGLVAVVFTILNSFVFRADEVRDPHGLYAVARQPSPNAEPERFTRAQYDAFLRETGIFAEAFAGTGRVDARIDGTRHEGPLVTGNFFGVLGVGAARGRALTPADDEPGAAAVLVLSHRAWTQHFRSDPGVVGRTVRLDDAPFEIVGVMPDGFRGLEPLAGPDFWAPLSVLDRLRGDAPARLEIVGRLNAGLSPEQATAQLVAWDARRELERSGERAATSLMLVPRAGTIPMSADVMLMFVPLFFAFGLILMIGCANVANLLLARAVARQREFGIRLAIGASRLRVVWQLLIENALLALVSAALALGISRAVLAGVVYWVTSTFPPGLGDVSLAVPPADWRVALFLVAGAIVSTLFFALAPALRATRLEPVRAIRGGAIGEGRPGRGRNALVALQVTASVLLLICAAVFLRSTWVAASIDPGIRTADVLTVGVLSEARRGDILDATAAEPLAGTVAAAFPGAVGGVPALAEAAGGASNVSFQLVSPEYFDVLGIDLVRGRGFTDGERDVTAAVAVVSEASARELWPDGDALGQVLRLDADPDGAAVGPQPPVDTDAPSPLARSYVVVGVVRDVPGFRLGTFRIAGAGVYVPIAAEAGNTALIVRARGNPDRARLALADRLARIDANMAEVDTLATLARAEAYLLSIPLWLTFALGMLALFLTLSGLFGVLSYVVEQRTREFGVRAALGATRRRLGLLVLRQSARPVGVGLVLGSGFIAVVGAALLATPAAELISSTVRLFDPLAYAGGVLCVVVACACAALVPALRAGRIEPVVALREE